MNRRGRFAYNDWATPLACPNTGICAGGKVGSDFRQTFDSTAVRVGAFGGRNWTLGPKWNSGAVPGITNDDMAAVNLQWNAGTLLFATAGAALQQVERVANRGGNGDDRVFAHVWVETHTVSLGAAYKF